MVDADADAGLIEGVRVGRLPGGEAVGKWRADCPVIRVAGTGSGRSRRYELSGPIVDNFVHAHFAIIYSTWILFS
jgi:hypothetical protein